MGNNYLIIISIKSITFLGYLKNILILLKQIYINKEILLFKLNIVF